MGGGEQMLLRIAEGARELGWWVRIVGPRWGELGDRCRTESFYYAGVRGSSRRTFAVNLAARLSRPGLGLVWANGALPALCATASPNPIVVHLHQRPSWKQSMALAPVRAQARTVVVPSEDMRAAIRGSTTLLNWTEDIKPITDRPPSTREPDEFTIAYLGRLSTDKGVDTLAAAANLLAEQQTDTRVRLLIAGDTRFVSAESAEKVADALQACSATVETPGWMPPAEVFARTDVCVVPSRWAEPFGLVAAEAMAAGVPLISSDAGGLLEVVGPNYPLVFPAGDVQRLADLLAQVHREPSDTTAARAAELRRRWETTFSPEVGQGRLEQLLGSLWR